MAERKFSELTAAAVLTDADILAISQIDSATASLMSKRTTLIAIANKLASLTNYTSELTTQDKTLTGAINELKGLISLIPHFSIEVVQTLPIQDISESTIYLTPSQNPQTQDAYDEFIYVNNAWEHVGSTAVDLSAYYTKLEVDGLLATKANTADVSAALALKENAADMEDDVTDIVVDLTDTRETTAGTPVTLTTVQEGVAKGVIASFSPSQTGTPWVDTNEVNKVPYLFRPVKNTATRIGNSLFDTLVGGTVAFNQLVNYSLSSFSIGNVSFTKNNDGTYTANGTNEINASANMVNFSCIVGHKYLMGLTGNSNVKSYDYQSYSIVQAKKGLYINNGRANNIVFRLTIEGGVTYNNEKIGLICSDLTAMFGSTIADYIYSLEQATAGSGVAYFRSLFPKDYYAYNAGQLMSVKALSHKMVGFNAFNVTTGKAKLVGGNLYQITGTYTAISYSTGETITPDSNGKFTPSASGELTVTGGDNTTCLHLVWDGERDGEYEAYSEHIYPLDSDLELRGIPKLDANNQLYYDGDTYESDGTVTRKYGIVDLGSLEWYKTARTEKDVFSTNYTSWNKLPFANDNVATKAISTAFSDMTIKNASLWNIGEALFTVTTGTLPATHFGIVVPKGKYADATAFKTAMNGVYLVYELATPTTETADTFENPQLVDNWGTEEYTDSREVQIPVGHETYHANLCPITGHDTITVTSNGTSKTTTFSETVYGGTADVVNGEGQKEWGYIASYNGETLPGEWLSDRDVYAVGTTPTTGAAVVYELATPTDFSFTGTKIPLAKGNNSISTNGDTVKVKYSKLALP